MAYNRQIHNRPHNVTLYYVLYCSGLCTIGSEAVIKEEIKCGNVTQSKISVLSSPMLSGLVMTGSLSVLILCLIPVCFAYKRLRRRRNRTARTYHEDDVRSIRGRPKLHNIIIAHDEVTILMHFQGHSSMMFYFCSLMKTQDLLSTPSTSH